MLSVGLLEAWMVGLWAETDYPSLSTTYDIKKNITITTTTDNDNYNNNNNNNDSNNNTTTTTA